MSLPRNKKRPIFFSSLPLSTHYVFLLENNLHRIYNVPTFSFKHSIDWEVCLIKMKKNDDNENSTFRNHFRQEEFSNRYVTLQSHFILFTSWRQRQKWGRKGKFYASWKNTFRIMYLKREKILVEIIKRQAVNYWNVTCVSYEMRHLMSCHSFHCDVS